MSKFSGKCDLYDELFMIRDDESYRRKCVVYIGFDSNEPIKNESDKDLVPYFPFVCCAGGGGADGWIGHYTERSWVDEEDERFLNDDLDALKKIYRRCKRKKEQFDVDSAVDELTRMWFRSDTDRYKFLAELVAKDGTKAKLPSIPAEYRSKSKDWFREALRDEMIKYGYTKDQADEWCFHGKKTW